MKITYVIKRKLNYLVQQTNKNDQFLFRSKPVNFESAYVNWRTSFFDQIAADLTCSRAFRNPEHCISAGDIQIFITVSPSKIRKYISRNRKKTAPDLISRRKIDLQSRI